MSKVLVLLSCLNMSWAFCQTLPLEQQISRANRRFMLVNQRCLGPSFAQKKCVFLRYYSPLKVDDFTETAADFFYHVGFPLSDAWENLQRGLNLLRDPENQHYWFSQKVSAETFAVIKRAVKIKQTQEGLSLCQSACLSSCVSSLFLDYQESATKSLQLALEEGQGVCREFSYVAKDLMDVLGVNNQLAAGLRYEVDTQLLTKSLQGMHVMNRVKIKQKTYLLEPQMGPENNLCFFFDPNFTEDQPKVETILFAD